MSETIDMDRKGCESIGSQSHFVTLKFYLTYFNLSHDFDLGFQMSNFEYSFSNEWPGPNPSHHRKHKWGNSFQNQNQESEIVYVDRHT